MRQWPTLLRPLRCFRRPSRNLTARICLRQRQLSTATTYIKPAESAAERLRKSYNVFHRIEAPDKISAAPAEEWLPLIESALPPHLRLESNAVVSTSALSGIDVAEILLAAQNLPAKGIGQDLLQYMGNVQQRWPAVVFLVKLIIDTFHHDVRQTAPRPPWMQDGIHNFETLTETAILHPAKPALQSGSQQDASRREWCSLDAFTQDSSDGNGSPRDILRRDALGQIWASLGNMIMTCVDTGGVVQPEILEMIAHLHHHGWMPDSIYQYKPHVDPTALQQPPILHLCFSRIMTSLSDAAWRGHERTVSESGIERPEIASRAYRVNVAGLRPEVWLELILWASLHGGWIAEGVHIMRLLISEKSGWRPMSWRSIVSPDEAQSTRWQEIEHLFNTRALNQDAQPAYNVHKTISSEVVNAYVDALITMAASNPSRNSADMDRLLVRLRVLHRFLDRSSSLVNGGTWDAAMVRILDHSGDSLLGSTHLIPKMLNLSSQFGAELQSAEASNLPSYVLDGSAAMLGALHHALRIQVEAGNLAGAVIVLQTLQSYTDTNKRISVNSFFDKLKSMQSKGLPRLFDSSYSGIRFPAFDPQIPADVLSGLVDLITDSKAFELGRWMLYSNAVDGALIPPHLYNDPILSSALVRFAVESNDPDLLSACVAKRQEEDSEGTRESGSALRSYMNSQITLRKWVVVEKLLGYMANNAKLEWTTQSLALLIATMIRARNENASEDLRAAECLFTKIVKGKYNVRLGQHETPAVRTLILILRTLDTHWANFTIPLLEMSSKSYIQFPLITRPFNILFEAIVACHGCLEGKRLLDIFWPPAVRAAQLQQRQAQPTFIPVLEEETSLRSIIYSPEDSIQPTVVRGGLRVNIRTLIILLGQAILEMKGASLLSQSFSEDPNNDDSEASSVDVNLREIIWWSIRNLRSLRMRKTELREELRSRLTEAQFEEIEAQLEIEMDVEVNEDYFDHGEVLELDHSDHAP